MTPEEFGNEKIKSLFGFYFFFFAYTGYVIPRNWD